jgi:hypothetical protein
MSYNTSVSLNLCHQPQQYSGQNCNVDNWFKFFEMALINQNYINKFKSILNLGKACYHSVSLTATYKRKNSDIHYLFCMGVNVFSYSRNNRHQPSCHFDQ